MQLDEGKVLERKLGDVTFCDPAIIGEKVSNSRRIECQQRVVWTFSAAMRHKERSRKRQTASGY